MEYKDLLAVQATVHHHRHARRVIDVAEPDIDTVAILYQGPKIKVGPHIPSTIVHPTDPEFSHIVQLAKDVVARRLGEAEAHLESIGVDKKTIGKLPDHSGLAIHNPIPKPEPKK